MWICPDCRTLYKKARKHCERDDAPLAEVKAHQVKSRYPLLGKVVGDRYHLIGGLGQGGLGTVYLAQHLHLEQLFAVKFLDLETVGLDVGRDQKEEYAKDFMKEARVASLIRHEAVVGVSDFGIYEKMPFLVMDYVPGPSLLQMLGEQGRFAVPEAINIARRIAEALGAFHERRLVHRDLKPANVILDPRGDGRLTLVDLGLVKDVSGHGGKASTHPMALRGTPGYLAPEQVPSWVLSGVGAAAGNEKRLVDARVDLYALGVLFYEMIAGVSPYPDGSNTQIIIWACTKDPLPLAGVDPPIKLIPGLEGLIYDTMARDPDQRPGSAREFIERLDEVAMGPAFQGSWPVIMVPGLRHKKRSGDPRPGAALAALMPAAGDGRAGPGDTEAVPPEQAMAAVSRAHRAASRAGHAEDLPFETDHEAGETATNLDALEGLLDDSQSELPTAIEGYLVDDDDDDMAPTQVEPLSARAAASLVATRISRVDFGSMDDEEPTKADMPPMMLLGSGFRLQEPAPAPVPVEPERRRMWLLLALPIVALLTGLVVWMVLGGGDEPVEDEPEVPARMTIGAQPEPREAEVVVAELIEPDAGEPDAAEPEGAVAEDEKKTVRKPRKRRSRERAAPDKDPRGKDREVRLRLRKGRAAMEKEDYSAALSQYEAFLKLVEYDVPPHPQFASIQNRVRKLRRLVGP